MPKGVYPTNGQQNKPRPYPEDLIESIRKCYLSGATQLEVATQLGIGRKIVEKVMKRHGIPGRKAAKRDQSGDKNHMWKGGEARYQALHLRVGQLRGKPQKCEECGREGSGSLYDWANISGRFDDPSDYKRLCRSCHHRLDHKEYNLGGYFHPKASA
jgi:hypothetical protein